MSDGIAFERTVRKLLESAGYFVIRSAGSFGCADLVCLKDDWPSGTEVLMVSVKANARGLSGREWDELWSIASKVGAVPLVVERPGRGRVAWWRLVGAKQARGQGPREPYEMENPSTLSLTLGGGRDGAEGRLGGG